MRQALHILKKDIRYLWSEITLLAVTLAAYVWIESRTEPNFGWVMIVRISIFLLTALLIARLIHGEALRGDRQFWITRPYRWQSLLAAKLTFMLLLVSLLFLAQAAGLGILDFPVDSWLSLLIWRQVPILVAVLWIAALAALTIGLAQFLFYEIVVLASGLLLIFGIESVIAPGFRSEPWLLISLTSAFSIALLAIVASAAVITLSFQYWRRRAFLSLAMALAGSGFLLVASSFPAFGRQPSGEPRESATIEIQIQSIEPIQKRMSRWTSFSRLSPVVKESGIPEGFETRHGRTTATFESNSGRKYAWQQNGWRTQSQLDAESAPGTHYFTFALPADQEFQDYFKDESTLPGKLRIAAEFELLRIVTRPVHVGKTPATVVSGLRCYLDNANRLTCQAPLRWPDGVAVGVGFGPGLASGYPYEPSLDLMVERAGEIVETGDLTVTIEERLGRFSRSVERQGIRPEDFYAPK